MDEILQRSIFDDEEIVQGEEDGEQVVNAEFSLDDIQYLQSLDEKLSNKKLVIKTQPFMSATLSNHLHHGEEG